MSVTLTDNSQTPEVKHVCIHPEFHPDVRCVMMWTSCLTGSHWRRDGAEPPRALPARCPWHIWAASLAGGRSPVAPGGHAGRRRRFPKDQPGFTTEPLYLWQIYAKLTHEAVLMLLCLPNSRQMLHRCDAEGHSSSGSCGIHSGAGGRWPRKSQTLVVSQRSDCVELCTHTRHGASQRRKLEEKSCSTGIKT